MSSVTHYEPHPIADIFPMMIGAEFEGLKADISARGLLTPIVLHEGMILDGRNRAKACEEAGVPIRLIEYAGSDPLVDVLSWNLHRRHLDASQRGMIAARLADMPRGGIREGNPKHANQSTNLSFDSTSQTEAAERLNVGRGTLQSCKKVLTNGCPELIAAVDAGEIPASVAAKVASLPEDSQREVIADRQLVDEDGETVYQKTSRMWADEDQRQRTAANHRAIGTGENEWHTPAQYIEAARSVMGVIDLDPASSSAAQSTVQAARFLTLTDDGLKHEWHGRVWMNPPYAQPAIWNFADKLATEFESGRVTEAIALTHNYTDTQWFHRLAAVASAICFTRGRIKFVSPSGELAAPTQGQAFFYCGPRTDAFREAFTEFGLVVTP